MTQAAIHFISIGGSVTHSLACSLQEKGYLITGSDDVIYDPSRTQLEKANLLPKEMGWHPDRIHKGLECVILGMHAKKDNPELAAAIEKDIPIYSYPEFIARFCQHKHRIVITGSHGKTTTTALVMHVLKSIKYSFDYLVGAPVDGFESCLQLSESPLIIIEGDEYPSSAIDLRAKFLQYAHHTGLITGISWDHINFYPSESSYVKAFEKFADLTPKAGNLIYNAKDPRTQRICKKPREDVSSIPYSLPKHQIKDGITYLIDKNDLIPLSVFGDHNLSNIGAALSILDKLSIPREVSCRAISNFKGAQRRAQCIYNAPDRCMYVDYAHAPSKVAAATDALKKQFPRRKLAAILELHTFSSLDPRFTSRYKDTLKAADLAIIYINPEVLSLRKGHNFTEKSLRETFSHSHLYYLREKDQILSTLQEHSASIGAYLFMSSGNFGGLSLEKCAQVLSHQSTTATHL